MHELAPLIYDLAIMWGVAAIVVILFQRIHQPVVLGYLVAGVIIGPHTPPYSLIAQGEEIKTLSELGVIFLMFSLGLEFSFHKLIKVGFPATITGFLEVGLMMLLGYGAGILLGWSFQDSLFLGSSLAISSTTIIIKAIDELKLKTKAFAELVFGILIVEDLLAILLLAGLTTLMMSEDVILSDMLFGAFKLITVISAWFIIGYFVVPSLFKQIANYVSSETLTIVSVALCLFLVTVAARYHYSAALGAFIMGSILAETVLVERIEKLILPIRDIFAAVFFISVGMLIDPVSVLEHWQLVLFLSLLTIFGKLLTTLLGALLTGQSLTTSVRAGFSMAQIGEFSFIIAGLGVALGVVGDFLYPIIVAVSAVTTFTTPYLIRLSGYLTERYEKKLPASITGSLKSYSAWVRKTQQSTGLIPWVRKISIRLFANGIVIAIIFTLVDRYVYNQILPITNQVDLSNVICVILSMILASPFIWGMLFAYRLMPIAKSHINPIVILTWFITIIELVFLSIIYFHAWIVVLMCVVGTLVFFGFAYKQVEKSYHWFERRFLKNIEHKKRKK